MNSRPLLATTASTVDPASLVTSCPGPPAGCRRQWKAGRSHSLRVAPRSPLFRVQREGLNWSLEQLRSTVGVSYPINTEPLPESRK
jgi:hypothetical protein